MKVWAESYLVFWRIGGVADAWKGAAWEDGHGAGAFGRGGLRAAGQGAGDIRGGFPRKK